MPVISYTRQTKEEIEYHISGKEILTLCDGLKIGPDDRVEIVYQVPRGGDYSGMELEVTEKTPVIVRVKRWLKEDS